MPVPDVQDPLNRSLVVVCPVFVKTIDHVVIPGRGQVGKIVGKPVAFDDDHMVGIDLADGIGYLYIGLFQKGPPGQVPVGFIDQVVPSHPGLSGIAFRQFSP